MAKLNDLVRAFTSEEGHSVVESLYDALPYDQRFIFEAEVEAYREDITEMRAALLEAETQSPSAPLTPPEKP